MKPSLLTDRYELTMLSSFLDEGLGSNRAVFETFARRLGRGRRFGMVAGLGRLLPQIMDFTFPAEEIEWLRSVGAITERTAEFLRDFRFSGDIYAYPEGEVYWPGSPVLRVEGTLAECVMLETLVLSVLNHDSAIASAAARMVIASHGRPIIEMGSRRVHEQAAVAVARAAYIAGFDSTSNLAAGRLYGIPTVGTAAHAFTLAHPTERDAFTAQMRALGPKTTLLVDTYDTEQGIRTAVEVAREMGEAGPGAIRLDSGDLVEESIKARALLDSLNAFSTRIVVTSDLDEYLMESLYGAPIDGYGAGTRVATGSGHPTAGMVYKLVAVADSPTGPLRPVAKRSSSKISVGGRKTPYRTPDGTEHFSLTGHIPPHASEVQRKVVEKGHVVIHEHLPEARDRARRALLDLHPQARLITDGEPWTTCTEKKGSRA